MDNESWHRLRGLTRLLHDGVRQGVDFVEKHHRHAAARPFRVLESVPPIAAPTKLVHGVHDAILWLSYGGIRTINHATELLDGWVLNSLAPPPDVSPPPAAHESEGAELKSLP
jgi:hypothetical protein